MEMTPNSMDIKQEGDDHHQTSYMSSLRQNPRIVRVSRAFGGKDRHSKVCTVRGLRDRRIRLSAMTAIQLYDLQDRLGLSQPSKVIDWLLQAAKNDIDLLPPLRFPPRFHPNLAGAGESYPGLFDPEPVSNQICIGHTKILDRHCFDPGSCSLKSDTIRRESLDLEQRRWDKTDESRNLVHGFDIDHHFFSNSSQSDDDIRLCFPTSSTYNSSSSYHYNLRHLQQSLVDQSGNVTVAFPNNNLNRSVGEAMSSPFPTYPSFLESGQLQLFSSNPNTSKQTDHVE